MKHHHQNRKQGQALIEFACGLVVLLVVVAALLQLSMLGLHQSRTMQKATEEAALLSINDGVTPAPPPYISSWEVGDDEKQYSVDDEMHNGNTGLLSEGILRHGEPDQLETYAPGNRISAAHQGDLAKAFELIKGSDSENGIPLLPIVRRTIYNATSIDLKTDVYMTWLKGLY